MGKWIFYDKNHLVMSAQDSKSFFGTVFLVRKDNKASSFQEKIVTPLSTGFSKSRARKILLEQNSEILSSSDSPEELAFNDFKEAVIFAGPGKFGPTGDMLDRVGKFEPVHENFLPLLEEYYSDDSAKLASAKEPISSLSNMVSSAKVIIGGEEFTIEGTQHSALIVWVLLPMDPLLVCKSWLCGPDIASLRAAVMEPQNTVPPTLGIF